MLTLTRDMSNVTVVTALKGRRFLMNITVQIPPIANTTALDKLTQKPSPCMIDTTTGNARPETATSAKNSWLSPW
jgi:hypothetical protein